MVCFLLCWLAGLSADGGPQSHFKEITMRKLLWICVLATGRTRDFTLNFRVHDGAAFHARPEIGIRTFADALQAIVGGNAYVNIHSSAFPGGEIRGQLFVADPNTPVFPAQ